ncbi:MAG: ATPase [Chloroflexia bacterium]|nr:ATPase [Chloroflexia bacterium]
MTEPQPLCQRAIVTGDVTFDWQIAHQKGSKERSWLWPHPQTWARASCQRGGAALLADLIQELAELLHRKGLAKLEVRQTGAPQELISPSDDRFHHSYALWSQFKSPTGAAWRVESFLGLDSRPEQAAPAEWNRVVNDTAEADLVVLDDAALGFREQAELWPQAIRGESRPWVLLKMSQPVAQGRLWEHLVGHLSDRLVVVMTVNDLRRTEVQISQGLSWERTAQDLAWELVHNPRVNSLARCAYAVISLGTAGVVIMSRPRIPGGELDKTSRPRFTLVFDPDGIEGTWEQQYPGGMIGSTMALTAGLADQLLISPEEPHVLRGVQRGLVAMRHLHREGYVEQEAAGRSQLCFPTAAVAAVLVETGTAFPQADVQDPVRFLTWSEEQDESPPAGGQWTILQDRYRDNLEQVAEQIVLQGAEEALQGVPLGRFGGMLTVDRQEIESFRSIASLVQEYLGQHRQKRPLSIAVFGAPGSGKSFGITQVAKSLAPGQIESLEFNLSQFTHGDEMIDALHQVRDVSLSGRLPLVFWDEFDSSYEGKALGWLRYFLAPMQDGRFRQGQVSHPIGRAIFVFAGGTSANMESFGRGLAPEIFRAVKGPDFVSRLKGYVNVLGPNRQGDGAGNALSDDPYYIIRRAILLRSILWRNVPQIFQRQNGNDVPDIDPGLLRAFLRTGRYKHGIRSMESIVAMSLLAGQTSYERSSLPSEAQMDLHVDGLEFLALVQQMALEGALLEKLAEAHHNVFCEEMRGQGYRRGELTDEQARTHSMIKPYSELSEEGKEDNRNAVRDIPNKLARIGYVMLPARSNEPPFEFPGPHLEQLAQLEHQRWVRDKLQAGWEYAPVTDKQKKQHACIVPWKDLPEEEREKDRMLVKAIPRILARAGYAVVQLREGEV